MIAEALEQGKIKESGGKYLSGYLLLMTMNVEETRKLFELISKDVKKLNKSLNELLKEIKKLNAHFEKISSAQENLLFYAEQTHKNTAALRQFLEGVE